ncbi:MAG TPA: helix-turn-helix transcriptional regulator [Gemmatales bacterium]|nr:helix-turn-helix transcriptional regulator [Gemmatales bacterium]
MPAVPLLTRSMVERITELRQAGKSYIEIAKELGIGRSLVGNVCRGESKPCIPDENDVAGWQEEENKAKWTGITSKPIKTEKELLKVCEVDLTVWYVKRWGCRAWTVGMKQDDKKPVRTQQFSVWADFERIEKKYLQEAKKLIDEQRAKWAPSFPKALKPKSKGSYLAVMGLVDVHIGKLCWAKETGKDYDLKIAEKVFEQAVEDLIAETRGREIANWVLPLGNDFFHIDGYKGQTTSGTQMDADGRYPKIFAVGASAARQAVLRMLTVAPVDVLWIPGNHDRHASYHLCRELAIDFQNNSSVNVDCGASSRKYFRYGSNLLGFTHGDKEKPDRLPNLMAAERRDWSETTSRDWYIGHVHNRKAWVTKPVETFEGSTVRVIKALTGTDAWHFEHGYIDDKQAAEVYFYEKTGGYAGHAVARART